MAVDVSKALTCSNKHGRFFQDTLWGGHRIDCPPEHRCWTCYVFGNWLTAGFISLAVNGHNMSLVVALSFRLS